jgi:hypothetical protein
MIVSQHVTALRMAQNSGCQCIHTIELKNLQAEKILMFLCNH